MYVTQTETVTYGLSVLFVHPGPRFPVFVLLRGIVVSNRVTLE